MHLQRETNATRELDRVGAEYTFLWDHTQGPAGGLEIAQGLQAPPGQVFKTLIMHNKKGQYFVFMVPVDRKLDSKKVKALIPDRLSMANEAELLEKAGYVPGGCSPVALKEDMRIIFDRSAQDFEKIYFGAGEISYHVHISLPELRKAISFELADIS